MRPHRTFYPLLLDSLAKYVCTPSIAALLLVIFARRHQLYCRRKRCRESDAASPTTPRGINGAGSCCTGSKVVADVPLVRRQVVASFRQKSAPKSNRFRVDRKPRNPICCNPRKAFWPPLCALKQEWTRGLHLQIVVPGRPSMRRPICAVVFGAKVTAPTGFGDDDRHLWNTNQLRLVSVDDQPWPLMHDIIIESAQYVSTK